VYVPQTAMCTGSALAATGVGGHPVEVHQLRCFVAVAEESNFGRAAERLHLTPSPVSRAVKDLERELGAELFVRRYHQVELTPMGRELLAEARDLLTGLDQLKRKARAAAHDAPRVIHLGGTYMAPPALFDRVVALTESVADGRPVDIYEAPSAELIPDVESGAIEIAFVHLPVAPARLDSVTIARYRFMVAMRSDDPLASAAELRLADLTDRTLVATSPKVQPLAMNRMYDRLREAGITKFDQLPENDTSLVASHVRRSRSLALTLAPAAGGPSRVFDDPAFALVPLADDRLDFTLGVIWRRDRAVSEPDVAALAEAARQIWGEGPDLI
jgi:DNA-binding transcriptional LysR family regulator